jgi:hypothetical protein
VLTSLHLALLGRGVRQVGPDGHRRHVLAEHVAFQNATRYGIGHAQTDDSPDAPGSSATYAVFLAAPPPAP